MKPITMVQWMAMSVKKRSWLVCRALGEEASVFWHCLAPDGTIVGGSYRSRDRCDFMIDAGKTLTKSHAKAKGLPYPHPLAACTPVPSASYAHYAEYDFLGSRLGGELFEKYGNFSLWRNGKTVVATSSDCEAAGDTIQEAVCLLVLKLHNLIK